VAGLRAGGATVMLLSGDQPETVASVASAVGIEGGSSHVHGAMSPQAKLDFVLDLQARGAVVAMFGDETDRWIGKRVTLHGSRPSKSR
jgi:Cu2+-exporting ATPase